jgi:hypothetical protein
MSIVRTVVLSFLLASLALLSPSRGSAAICGFPGLVLAGAFGGGVGWVTLFSVAPPFALSGIASTALGAPIGPACMDLWTGSLLGPPPPNFNAVWGAAPAGCAGPCSPVAISCSATLCAAFP